LNCRHCSAPLSLTMIDLGSAPPSNAYLTDDSRHAPEPWLPLKVLVCTHCWLAQTEDTTGTEHLFAADYAYFSSYSDSWLAHSERYVAAMQARFGLDTGSHVVEVAANDGYLLRYVRERGIPCLGIEPTAGTAAAARARGIEIVERFFGVGLAAELAAQGRRADLMVANNVLAHVPDINDFVAGFAGLLKPNGVATFEFPHLLRLVAGKQFDTIYHEHFSYLSLTAVDRVFAANELEVFDVEELATHGGSLRVYAQRADTRSRPRSPNVETLLAAEETAGVRTPEFYTEVQTDSNLIKYALIDFLIDAKRSDKKVAAYGAAAKGNTLLNYAGIRSDLIPWVVDRNPAKQGKYLPGSRIPIVTETRIREERPDFVLILPWNIADEIVANLAYIRSWQGRFVTAVPALNIR
jgi:SAM-dependent methyltransferase